MTQKFRLYDNSRLGDAKTCLRYYLLRHVYHWEAVGTKNALVFGSSWGAALDSIWANIDKLYVSKASQTAMIAEAYNAFVACWTERGLPHPDNMSPDDIDQFTPRTPMVAMEMLYSYVEAREHIFTDPSFELLGIEEPFIIPLDPNDATLWYVGRLDKKFRYRRKIIAGEHKTTALYRKIGNFQIDWVDGWSMDDQSDGYNYNLLYKHGNEAGGVYIDGALVHKTVHDAFKIIPLDKRAEQLDAWLYDTHWWIDQIEANKEVLEERSKLDTNYLAAFPRNRKSCIGKYGRCQFFDICQAHANPAKIKDNVPLGFQVRPWSPFDELKLEKIGITADQVEKV